ncbi:hypothetical protein C8J55DRAFT_529026 [Lentinula edodes]|uniref:Uncharacterized protein n=1 Tax=Lentinula lateritia TaxID=40482 RepID=A0A9W8ZRX2_9AGAR|nr:hypothetical protein C8J55DRAFT_529026 [Lentinula edodes]
MVVTKALCLNEDTAENVELELLRLKFSLLKHQATFIDATALFFRRGRTTCKTRSITPCSVSIEYSRSREYTIWWRETERENHSSIGGDHGCCISSCLPDRAQHPLFLFPFATRYHFLQSTSFGYARLILEWQSQQLRGGQDSSRRDDGFKFLERLERQKVRVPRRHHHLGEWCQSGVPRGSWGIFGTDFGVLREGFKGRDSGLGASGADASPFVHHPSELKRTSGQAIRSQGTVRVAELVLGEEVPLTIETLKLVNNNLANSLTKLPTIAPADKQPPLNDELALIEETVTVEAPALDLTLPGYDIELKPSEKESL